MLELADGFDFDEEDEQIITGVNEVPAAILAQGTARGERLAPAARLVCVTGGEIGRVFPVGAISTVIGRAADADVRVRVADVSRHHAKITWRERAYVLEDLASANGTFVNGAPVRGPTTLAMGDRVQVGDNTIFVLGAHDELEARAAQLQKLDAMQQLVGGLARGFGDALMVIHGGLDELASRVQLDDDLREVFDDVIAAAHSASQLAARLNDLQGRARDAHEVIDVASLVRGAIAGVRPALGASIAVTTQIDPGARVRGSKDGLLDGIVAIVANARDAMPNGGKLTVTASVRAFGHADALARHLPGEGAFVEISIADTGAGMDAATLARMFEPFFTTKRGKEGAGLSLATVHSTIRQHDGAIVAESEEGRGTTLRMWLPAAAGPHA
ncbi:MAG TPA: FHA domain-containing protein [Kofleriaceae bacterium]|nr:FHA domain-containing protein [Kofleriaceae bacterium]